MDGEWLLVGEGAPAADYFKRVVGYNARDQVVRQVEPGGNTGEFGEWLTHGYDAYGRPVSLTGDGDYVTDASYDAHGRLTEVVFGNDIVTHYSYWAPNETYGGAGQGGRLHELKTGTVADPTGVQHLSYAYDKVGNVASTWDMNNPPTSGYQRMDYVYDALDRLTDAETSGGAYSFSKHYAYSVDGNIETFGTRTLGYDDPDHPHAVTLVFGQTRYHYDANGNMSSRHTPAGWQTLSYDAENRLAGITGPVTATFTYDAAGARVRRTVNGQTTIHFGEG